MSFLSKLTGIDINVGKIIDGVTGKAGADAAKSAAATQSAAATAAAAEQAASEEAQIARQEAGLAQQRTDLQGAVDFGQGLESQANTAFQQQGALFGPNAGNQIMNNPMFQAIQAQNRRDIEANQSLGGRLNTGETPQFLQDSALRTGFDVLNQERQAAIANSSSLLNPVSMGFNAAAQQGQGALNTGANVANTMQNSIANQNNLNTGAAAATAAGTIGAANAQTAGAGNIIGGITGLATSGLKFGLPSFSDVGTKIGTVLNPTQNLSQPGRFGR